MVFFFGIGLRAKLPTSVAYMLKAPARCDV